MLDVGHVVVGGREERRVDGDGDGVCNSCWLDAAYSVLQPHFAWNISVVWMDGWMADGCELFSFLFFFSYFFFFFFFWGA